MMRLKVLILAFYYLISLISLSKRIFINRV